MTPSARFASAAIATDSGASDPFNGTYKAGPFKVARPWSVVERQSAASPLRSKCSSTGEPIVVRPVTWYSLNVPSSARR